MVVYKRSTPEMLKVAADTFLTEINREFITLHDGEKHEYMEHFKFALEEWLKLMKENDVLFNAIFQRVSWSGSYYDGLKITKPEEYDIMLVMKLPVNYSEVEMSNRSVMPTFIKVGMEELGQLRKHPRYQEVYKPMEDWIDQDGFILQSKFRAWMASVVGKAQATMTPSNSLTDYLYRVKESGPARTIHVSVPMKYSKPGDPRIELDFDLVPVIAFEACEHWPQQPFRRNPFPGPTPPFDHMVWYIVAKPTSKLVAQALQNDNFWRANFYDQECEILRNKYNLKPALRMVKKLRDAQNLTNIKSYYIKTVFMWEVDRRPATYWTETSFCTIFIDMLGKLRDAFQSGAILHYWDKRANLLTMSGMKAEEIANIGNNLSNIVHEIESKSDDGYVNVFAKYLLTEEELKTYQAKVPYQTATDTLSGLRIRN